MNSTFNELLITPVIFEDGGEEEVDLEEARKIYYGDLRKPNYVLTAKSDLKFKHEINRDLKGKVNNSDLAKIMAVIDQHIQIVNSNCEVTA